MLLDGIRRSIRFRTRNLFAMATAFERTTQDTHHMSAKETAGRLNNAQRIHSASSVSLIQKKVKTSDLTKMREHLFRSSLCMKQKIQSSLCDSLAVSFALTVCALICHHNSFSKLNRFNQRSRVRNLMPLFMHMSMVRIVVQLEPFRLICIPSAHSYTYILMNWHSKSYSLDHISHSITSSVYAISIFFRERHMSPIFYVSIYPAASIC